MTLREYCDQPGMSVARLSELTGIHPSILYRWINAEVAPSGENLARLLRVTKDQVSVEQLLGIKRRKGKAA